MELETDGMFGYKACALIRSKQVVGQYAFQHWLNYQRLVAGVPYPKVKRRRRAR